MTFSPVIPGGGLAGWNFLKSTEVQQKEVLARTGQNARDAEYFRQNISQVTTAEALVSDRTLLNQALTAFGLQDDLDNRFFIRKVLSDGTLSDDALSNRLADKRYLEFSHAFGFGPGERLQTQLPGFADTILNRALNESFEIAVGEQDPDLRLAIGLDEDLSTIAGRNSTETAKWFTVLGTPPVRAVFEAALGLPSAIGVQDIDLQLETFKMRARAVFGTDKISDFQSEDLRDHLVRNFLLQRQIGEFSVSNGASNALALLQGTG